MVNGVKPKNCTPFLNPSPPSPEAKTSFDFYEWPFPQQEIQECENQESQETPELKNQKMQIGFQKKTRILNSHSKNTYSETQKYKTEKLQTHKNHKMQNKIQNSNINKETHSKNPKSTKKTKSQKIPKFKNPNKNIQKMDRGYENPPPPSSG